MTPPLRPERSPAEYLMALRVSDPERAKAFEAFLVERGQDHHIGIANRQMTYRSGGLERMNRNANAVDAERTPGEQVTTALNSALDAGTFGVAGLAADALAPGDFRANRDARQAEYGRMSTSDRVLSGLAGGLANPVGRVLKPVAAGSGYLATAGRGALEGALQGAATGFGENVGTTEGAGMGTAIGAVGGAVGGAVLTPLAKALLSRGGGVAEDATRRALDAQVADAGPVAPAAQPQGASLRDLIQRPGTVNWSDEVSRAGRLSRPTLQQTPLAPVPQDMPTPMAVDVAGPNMVANARGATSTVPGREGFRGPFEARSGERVQAIGNAFDRVTGTTADDAERLAVELADAERGLATATTAQKAQYEQMVQGLRQQHAAAVAQARAVQAPPKPQPRTITDALDALNSEAPSEDAVLALRRMMEERNALAKRVYGEAWDETKGEIVDSDIISAILKTPMGRRAFNEMVASRPNVSALDPTRRIPTVEKFDGADLVDAPVPDAEALHGMKRMLSEWAKLSPDAQAASGINAKSASESLNLFQLLRDELPDVVRQADATYAEASAPISAMREGLARHSSNPTNLNRALSTVEERAGQMPPGPREALNLGQRFKIESLFRAGLSPKRAAELLMDPRTDLAREVSLGYGPEAPARLAQALRTPDATPFQRPVVAPFVAPLRPAAPQMPSTMTAALRGVDIPRTPMVPTGSNPERSLPTVLRDMGQMPQADAAQLRRGAAAGFRRELGAGKELRLDVPERRAQFGVASPSGADEMAGIESAWSRAMRRQSDVLPEGQLAIEPTVNSAIAAAAEVADPYAARMGVRAVRRMLGKSSAANMAERGAEDAAFAGLMTGRPETLADALANLAAKDQRMSSRLSRTAGTAGRVAGDKR